MRCRDRETFNDALRCLNSTVKLPMPEGLEDFMYGTPIKRMLRGIYGQSNLAVALILLRSAARERVLMLWTGLMLRIGIWKDELGELEDDESEEAT